MQGYLYCVPLLLNIFTPEIDAAHCPRGESIPVVHMCFEGQQESTKVYIDGSSATRLDVPNKTACVCDVNLYNNPSSNQILVSSPGFDGCGSKIEVQEHSSPAAKYFGCKYEGAYPYFLPNFTVTFRATESTFSTEYCLLIEPDVHVPLSNASAFVKCYSVSPSTGTTAKMSTKTSTVITTEYSKITTTSRTTFITTKEAEGLTNDGDTDEASIVPIAVGAGVGGVIVLAIIMTVSIFFCRRKKGKASSKPQNLNETVEMTDNALYNMPIADGHVNANGKSSTLEIRHIEVEGGDIYALPSKPNTTSQLQNRSTLQEEYSEPLGTGSGEKSTETEKDYIHKEHINSAFVGEKGTKRETVKSNYYAEPEDGIKNPQTGKGMDSNYAEIC